MQPVIQRTDELLRVRFGDEQTDDLLDAYRRDDHDRLTAYTTALQLTCDLTDRAATSSEDVRGTAHILLAARDDNVRLTALDRLRRQMQCF